MPATTPFLELGNIRFEPNRVLEVDSGRVMHFVPRDEIKSIGLRYGFVSRHPLIQAIFGLMLASLGIIPVVHLIYWFLNGGTFVELEIGLIVVAILGLSLTLGAARRSWLLEIDGKQRRKLEFGRRIDREAAKSFVEAAKDEFGYVVEVASNAMLD